MNDSAPVSIVEVVTEARRTAVNTLCKLFEASTDDDLRDVMRFQDTLCLLQGMPNELVENVALPIIRQFFVDYDMEITNRADRVDVAMCDKLIAAGINAAVQAVMQQVRQEEAMRQQARQRLLHPGR